MKKLLLGAAALLALAGGAGAADLPTKAPLKAPPPVVTYDWNGFYIGGYYGTSVGQTKAHTDRPGTVTSLPGVVDINGGGLVLGALLGYNWQFAPNWLVGLEGDFGTLGIDRTFNDWNDGILAGSKADWYSTVRGRFGYVTGPSLLYVTGGAAFVHIKDTFGGGGPFIGQPGPAIPAIANTTTKTGWTVGGGIETKLSRNWSSKTEYLFIEAGSTNFASDAYSVPGTPTTFDHSYHVITTSLNYKLDGNWEGLPFFGPPMPSNHPWGGFYAGANIGGGISLVRAINDAPNSTAGEEDVNGTGFAGGGHVGYNYMISNKWFAGVEGDIGYLGIRGSVADWNDTRDMFQVKTNWYATARGRVGASTGPALMYFTAGGAWVNLQDGFAPNLSVGDLSTRTAGGWTVGGGTEVALDSRWSARIESLYIDVGHRNHTDNAATPFFADFKERFMVVRAGLTYQFGGP